MVLLAAWAGITAITVHWLGQNHAPLSFDQSHHFLLSLGYREILADPLRWPDLCSFAIYYPPLFHTSLAAMMLVGGVSLPYAPLINSFWLLMLMLPTWLLGRESFGRAAGLAGAVLLALIPASAGLTREVLMEVCLAAMVAWAVWALARSRGLSSRRWLLLLGALAGLGMLAKWTFAMYMLGPLAWCLYWGHRRGLAVDWRGVAWALVIGAAVCLPWYLHSPATLIKNMLINAGPVALREGDPPVFSLDGLLYYPLSLVNDQMFLPLAVLAVLGLAAGLVWRRERTSLLAVWFITGLVLITLLRNKDSRYLYPLLAPACLFAVGWAGMLGRRGLRFIALAAVLALAILHFGAVSYGWGPLAPERVWWVGGKPLRVSGPKAVYARRPSPHDWQLPAILAATEGDWSRKSRSPRLGVVAALTYFNKLALESWAAAYGNRVCVVSAVEPTHWRPGRAERDMLRDLMGLDYLVTKSGGLGLDPDYGRVQKAAQKALLTKARLVKEFPMPDGGRAVLWRLANDPARPVPPCD
ncbi:MAG: glycosyltransferase family 39 protein [Proteobacteria bacterium]|nr:glycosyltransferase family 39 protein [Pseudomonadota bacterium]MBU4385126.1 glycosyltransferase family 39 protein [Pseudomonadota bacterium]MCG2764733.1 glycosyltransferase family 39 protein [Desulfarculaceae bacterium]